MSSLPVQYLWTGGQGPHNPFRDKICRLKKQLEAGCQNRRNFVQEPVSGLISRVGKINASIKKNGISKSFTTALSKSQL